VDLWSMLRHEKGSELRDCHRIQAHSHISAYKSVRNWVPTFPSWFPFWELKFYKCIESLGQGSNLFQIGFFLDHHKGLEELISKVSSQFSF